MTLELGSAGVDGAAVTLAMVVSVITGATLRPTPRQRPFARLAADDPTERKVRMVSWARASGDDAPSPGSPACGRTSPPWSAVRSRRASTAPPRTSIDRLESNGVRTVIVERADRLARDLMVQEVILAQFVKVGARILTADGVDLTSSDDPTRRLIRQVLGAEAEVEKNVLVLK